MKKEMTFAELKPLVKECLRINQPVLLLGDAGIGKSSFLESIAEPVFTVGVNQLSDKADISGIRLIPIGKNSNGEEEYAQKFFPHVTIMDCIRYAEENPNSAPVLFLDEINRAGSDITSYCLSFITQHAIGDRRIPSNVRFVFAGNHIGNITALDDASLSRFAMFFAVPDLETFLECNPNLHPNIKDVLQHNPDTLCCKTIHEMGSDDENDPDDDENDFKALEEMMNQDQTFEQITTPRTITGLSNFLNNFDDNTLKQMAINETLLPVLQGFTGNTKFTSLLSQSIATKLIQTVTTTSVKPARYDMLKNATTVDAMASLVNNMTPTERCEILSYALCERTDNRLLIQQTANGLSATDQEQINLIMRAISSGAMNPDNAAAFRQCTATSPLAAMFQNFFV